MSGGVTRILLADDHGLFRAGIADILSRGFPGAELDQAQDLPSVLQRLAAGDYDLILLDVFMPGMEGAASARQVADAAPTTPVVAVSALEDPAAIRRLMETGIAGFISKSVDHNRFVAGLRGVLETGTPCILGAAPAPDPALDLSPRQRQIMGLIREGLSNQQIAARLAISEGTVKIHVSAILRNLGASNRTEAVARWFGTAGL
jgi:DNA-binding NarL/FixJ family response regulator